MLDSNIKPVRAVNGTLWQLRNLPSNIILLLFVVCCCCRCGCNSGACRYARRVSALHVAWASIITQYNPHGRSATRVTLLPCLMGVLPRGRPRRPWPHPRGYKKNHVGAPPASCATPYHQWVLLGAYGPAYATFGGHVTLKNTPGA